MSQDEDDKHNCKNDILYDMLALVIPWTYLESEPLLIHNITPKDWKKLFLLSTLFIWCKPWLNP